MVDNPKVRVTVYSCQHKNEGCKKTMLLCDDVYYKESRAEHVHAADPFDIESRRVVQKAYNALRDAPSVGADFYEVST
jgi:hypothetical protein